MATRLSPVPTPELLPPPHGLIVGTPSSGTTLVERLPSEVDGQGLAAERRRHHLTDSIDLRG